MKKYHLLIAIILLALIPQYYFGQTFSKKLENTYWKRTGYYAKSGTMNFETLPEKPTQTANFDYFGFEKDNSFIFHIAASKACSADLVGKYKIEKSKISFTTAQTKINGDCGNLKEFKLTDNSIVFRNGVLYLAKYSNWYDEAPVKKGDTIFIALNQIGEQSSENGKSKISDSNGIPFEDGTYKIIETTDSPGKSVFSSKNGLLDRDLIIKGVGEEYKSVYRDGDLIGEKRLKDNKLYYEKSVYSDVTKENSGHYRIKLTEISKNLSRNIKDSVITIYADNLPVNRFRYQDNFLAADMDFKNKVFKKYNFNGKIMEVQAPGSLTTYDDAGNEETKELYQRGSYELYKYGKLRLKRTVTGDNVTTITYDEKGKIQDKKVENYIQETIIDDSDRYAKTLSPEEFEYYKKQAK